MKIVAGSCVPPENVAVTVPLFTPMQVTSVCASDRLSAAGDPTAIDWLAVQLLASRTITVCDPVASPVKVRGDATVVKPPPSISVWSVPVPPEKVAVIVPSVAP